MLYIRRYRSYLIPGVGCDSHANLGVVNKGVSIKMASAGVSTMPVMTFEEFQASLELESPPAGLAALPTAMWWAAKGNWTRAHEIAQDVASSHGAWVHAYLHRKEGDEGNAGYWYRQAGRPHTRLSLAAEWDEIVKMLLAAPEPDAK
jgi:hypothetical protein